MKLFYKILFFFLGKALFSLPLHNPGRITSILTHINTFISELVFFTWSKARGVPDEGRTGLTSIESRFDMEPIPD